MSKHSYAQYSSCYGSGRSVSFLLVSLCLVKICVKIENLSTCEVQSVIRYLLTKNYKPIEILCQLFEDYGNGIKGESRVRQYCIDFKIGNTNIYDETYSGRPSLMTENLWMKINEKKL